MDERTRTCRRGIRMAMQVATLTVGVGALAAAAAVEARADTGPGAGAAGVPDVASAERVTSHGWSCWGGPVSRGPLAPPIQDAADPARLLEELAS